MEERKEVVCKMVSMGMRTDKALEITKIPRSSYYYRSTGVRKGKGSSTYVLKNGQLVSNEQLVNEMNDILGIDFIDYGYGRTTKALVEKDYHVNKKKIYRLMKINHLLLKKKKAAVKKNYVTTNHWLTCQQVNSLAHQHISTSAHYPIAPLPKQICSASS